MRILPIINHLKNNCPLLSQRIEVGTRYVSLMPEEIDTDLPVAFVFKGAPQTAEPDMLLGRAVSQAVYERIYILIAAQVVVGATEPMEDVREQIKSVMTGYTIDEQHSNFSFVNDDPGYVYSAMGWHVDVYQSYFIHH
jgi:hypothetical protein